MRVGELLDQILEYVDAALDSGFQPYKEIRPELHGSSVPPLAFIHHQIHYNALAPILFSRAIRRKP